MKREDIAGAYSIGNRNVCRGDISWAHSTAKPLRPPSWMVSSSKGIVVFLYGDFDEFSLRHEGLVSRLHQTAIPCHQCNTYAFLQSRQESIAVGKQVVVDNLFVADTVRFQ